MNAQTKIFLAAALGSALVTGGFLASQDGHVKSHAVKSSKTRIALEKEFYEATAKVYRVENSDPCLMFLSPEKERDKETLALYAGIRDISSVPGKKLMDVTKGLKARLVDMHHDAKNKDAGSSAGGSSEKSFMSSGGYCSNAGYMGRNGMFWSYLIKSYRNAIRVPFSPSK